MRSNFADNYRGLQGMRRGGPRLSSWGGPPTNHLLH